MSTSARPLILASASPRRRELLAELGVPFAVRSASVDETPQPGESPEALVRRLSRAKALAVAAQSAASAPGAIILAADTTVVLDGEILGKPADVAEATAMLRRLRGGAHTVLTAIALLDTGDNRLITDLAVTRVTMRDYSDDEIAAYVASGDPFDKAGGYAIQHAGFQPVASIQGSYTNVVGLPLEQVAAGLRQLGLAVHPSPR
jgi:septum formation protein